MRTIQQALEILDNIPLKSGLFCCIHPDKTKALRSLLTQFDSNKYATPDDDTRARILSSIAVEIDELEELNKNNTSIINRLNQIKEIITENLDYYSPENVYCYWRGQDNPVSSSPPGIAILCNDSRGKNGRASGDFPLDFKQKALENLDYIAQTPTGNLLLERLLDLLAQNKDLKIEIIPAPLKQGNRAIPHDIYGSMEKVAFEISSGKILKYSHRALESAAQENCPKKVNPIEWLTEKINELPLFSLDSAPVKFTDTHKPFLAKDIAGWFDSGKNGYLYLTQIYDRDSIAQLLCATIAVLHPYAEPSQGSGTTVRWNAFSEHPNNQKRPAAIGLAHELIHAFYNARGEEPGKEQDDTTALIEYLAIGLGPYQENKISENAIRAQWHALLQLISIYDALSNKQEPGLRTQYNDAPVEENLSLGLRI